MKRFAAFCIEDYYPAGADGDCVGRFDTLEEAKARALLKCATATFANPRVWDLDTDEVHDLRMGEWQVRLARFAKVVVA